MRFCRQCGSVHIARTSEGGERSEDEGLQEVDIDAEELAEELEKVTDGDGEPWGVTD